ncbi:YlmC/YmxH family sporulation protein [Thermosediminibacter oceani]|uniref:Sporulation protein, YlmC/YmxH family n=1 Tax=Thermosediminibacter oceani (strain ATCC BAA-1034 / DSM 16646 / JW/IW-1228P) TaxID=555079 RepID=D9S2U9_THEOJ|nr:YlmC/YmxH family sporulation protein [Thermosediminibacter oceani]ADL07726.1 sporulation protein, YlmC/YmxH family [Thermosediminibacter oceani DSM 16646]
MLKASDLRQREVINIADGKKLGFISDLDIDVEEGRIRAVIVPAPTKILSVFGKGGDYVIPWEKIKKIGNDVILIELSDFTEPKKGM